MNKNDKLLSVLTDLSELKSNKKIINNFTASVNLLYPESDIQFKKSKKIEKNSIPIIISKNIYGIFSINNYFMLDNLTAVNSIKNAVKLLTVILENNIAKINYKKKIEHNLPDNKKEKFFNLAIDMLCIAGFDGYFIQLNKAWTKTLGYSTSELMKRPWIDFVHEEDKKNTIKAGKDLINGKNVLDFLNRYICKDGSIKWLSWDSYPDVKSKIIYAIARDVTDLRKEKNKAQNYLNIADVMLIVINNKGFITLINKKGEDILGYKKNEIIGKNWFDTCIPIQMRKEIKNVFHKLIKGKINPIEYFENPIINKKGEERLIAWHNTIIKSEDGKITGTLSSGEDITEKKKYETQLKEINLKLEMALESGRTDSWEMNLADKTLTYTDRWAEYLGYKPGEVPYTQEAAASIIHEDDLEKIKTDLLNHLEGRTPIYETECRIRKKNGDYIWISTRGKIIEWDRDNNPVRLIGINFDITQLKNIENKLRESEERYRMLIENSNEAITLFDTKGKIIILNSVAAKFLGRKPEDIIGKTYYEILPESLITEYENTINKILKTKQGIVSENILTLNNKEYWLIRSTQPIFDSKGNIIHFLTISLDITQKKIDEQEKEELMYKLRSKNEELKTILYVTTHDLRTPLVNIQGFSKELILSCNQIKEIINKMDNNTKKELLPIIDEELPKDLKFITVNIEKMDKLLKGLLMLSRISNKQITYTIINTNKLFSKIIESIYYQLKEKNADIQIDTLPNCYGQEDQLNQVFTNIIINSIKYSKNDKPLQIKITGKKEKKSSIFCIEDNGIGINPNHKDKIFRIFHRLNPNDPISGEGLGLTIVKRIIERHKGQIWIESELNKGCKFYIQIPNKTK